MNEYDIMPGIKYGRSLNSNAFHTPFKAKEQVQHLARNKNYRSRASNALHTTPTSIIILRPGPGTPHLNGQQSPNSKNSKMGKMTPVGPKIGVQKSNPFL
jgi:anthranilate/para-aminobenzoate synthase component II